MKLRTAALSLLCIALATIQADAQFRGTCGVTDPMPFLERVTMHQKEIAQGLVDFRSGAPKFVPVTFILVADDNGNDRAREEQVLDQLAKLNEYYEAMEIVFYIDEIRYKDHTLIFNEPSHNTSIFQMKLVKDANAMNVYVTKLADSGSGNPGVTLGYYSPQNDWIVMRKDEFNGLNNTLAHEGGHFFSLPHPHSGWECEPYDPNVHGNPVENTFTPCNSGLQVELQNGSNCQTAGDRICDTNPDYNFGFGWDVGGDRCAEYTPEVRDPNGDVVDVVENNQMGYFADCDDFEFSPIQMQIVQSDYQSSSRSYLRTGYTPDQDPVDNNVEYVYPVGGEEVGTTGIVDLDWEDVPGATDYLVIVDRSATFGLLPRRFIVQESFLTVEGLSPNLTYHWKIWPYNESKTGAGWAARQTFHTGEVSAVSTIPSVDNIEVFPNPVQSSGNLTLTIDASSAFDAEITLLDITGEVAWYSSKYRIEAGKHTVVPIEIRNAPTGLYILKVQSSEGGVISRKVSVQ